MKITDIELERYNELFEIRREKFLDDEQFEIEQEKELNYLFRKINDSYEIFISPNYCDSLPNIYLKTYSPQKGLQYYWAEVFIRNNEIIGLKNGYYDIVLTSEGSLRFGRGHYCLSGYAESVKGAGGVRIENRKIVILHNSSGHYQPNKQDNINFKNLLEYINITFYE